MCRPPCALLQLDFSVGRSLRCQAVISQPNGIHRLATVDTPGRANHSEPKNPMWTKHGNPGKSLIANGTAELACTFCRHPKTQNG